MAYNDILKFLHNNLVRFFFEIFETEGLRSCKVAFWYHSNLFISSFIL